MDTRSRATTTHAAYLGLYVSPDEHTKIVLTLERSTLTLALYGVPRVRFKIEPHMVSSTGWPPGLFELARCCITTTGHRATGHNFTNFDMIRFECECAKITSLRWTLFKDRPPITFTKLPAQSSALLRLPSEVRNIIIGHAIRGNNEKIIISRQGTAFDAFHTCSDTKDSYIHVNQLQRACLLLHHETHGLEYTQNRVSASEPAFRHLLEVSEELVKHRIRRLTILSIKNVIKGNSTDLQLGPMLHFCIAHPEAKLRLVLNCWHYADGYNVLDLIRTGWLLERAFRDKPHKNLLPADKAIVSALKGTPALVGMEVKNIRMFPRCRFAYKKAAVERQYMGMTLAKKPPRMLRPISQEYRSLKEVWHTLERWHSQGI